jgi:hypothetical protein
MSARGIASSARSLSLKPSDGTDATAMSAHAAFCVRKQVFACLIARTTFSWAEAFNGGNGFRLSTSH